MDPGLLKGHCKWTRALAFILESEESLQSHHTVASTVVWDILIGSLPGEKLGPNGVPFALEGPTGRPDCVAPFCQTWPHLGCSRGWVECS